METGLIQIFRKKLKIYIFHIYILYLYKFLFAKIPNHSLRVTYNVGTY